LFIEVGGRREELMYNNDWLKKGNEICGNSL
jgi:hypothetical protein